MTDRLRKILALAFTALPLVVVAAALARAELPDPVPSHWDLAGEVDGTMGRVPFVVLTLALTGGGALIAAGFARSEWPRYGLVASAFTAWLMGGLGVLTVVVASGTGTAEEVDLPAVGLAVAVAAALAGPALVGLLWPVPEPDRSGPAPELPRLELRDGERVVYLADIRSSNFAVLAVACAVIGLIVALLLDVLIGFSLLAVTAAALVLQRATVRIDVTGLRIAFGPGIRICIPLADIRQASAEQIRPMEWGGWGYRVRPGQRALVLRGGPGLVLDLVNGNRFAVTLDDPDQAAAVLNGLLDRSHRS